MGVQLICGEAVDLDCVSPQEACAEGNTARGYSVDFGRPGAAGRKLWPGSGVDASSMAAEGASGKDCCAFADPAIQPQKKKNKTILSCDLCCMPDPRRCTRRL